MVSTFLVRSNGAFYDLKIGRCSSLLNVMLVSLIKWFAKIFLICKIKFLLNLALFTVPKINFFPKFSDIKLGQFFYKSSELKCKQISITLL